MSQWLRNIYRYRGNIVDVTIIVKKRVSRKLNGPVYNNGELLFLSNEIRFLRNERDDLFVTPGHAALGDITCTRKSTWKLLATTFLYFSALLAVWPNCSRLHLCLLSLLIKTGEWIFVTVFEYHFIQINLQPSSCMYRYFIGIFKIFDEIYYTYNMRSTKYLY